MSTDAPGRADDVVAIAAASRSLLEAVNAGEVGGVMAVWSEAGVLMPPHHPAVEGRDAIAAYFTRLFAAVRLAFTFTASRVEVAGDLAVERLDYTAWAWPLPDGVPVEDVGKGVHVYARQADGSWKLAQDIWNSDLDPPPAA